MLFKNFRIFLFLYCITLILDLNRLHIGDIEKKHKESRGIKYEWNSYIERVYDNISNAKNYFIKNFTDTIKDLVLITIFILFYWISSYKKKNFYKY